MKVFSLVQTLGLLALSWVVTTSSESEEQSANRMIPFLGGMLSNSSNGTNGTNGTSLKYNCVDSNCYSCYSNTSGTCTSCYSGYYLSSGYCYQCPYNCYSCSSSYCSSCASGYRPSNYYNTCEKKSSDAVPTFLAIVAIFCIFIGIYYAVRSCKKQQPKADPAGAYGYAPQQGGPQNPFGTAYPGAYQQPAYGGYGAPQPQYGAAPVYGQPNNTNPFAN